VAAAAAQLEPPKEIKLKDSEGLKIRRQAAQAARYGEQVSTASRSTAPI